MWLPLVLLLVAGKFQAATATTVEQSFGKLNMTESSSDGFYCDAVHFPTPFQNGGTIRVFPSLSHEDHPGNRNEAAVAVVTAIDQYSFSVCLMEPAQPSGEMTLNWFAFSDVSLPLGALTGSIFYSVFTSGSVCQDIAYSRIFSAPPKIFLSVYHAGRASRRDMMSLWAEDVTESQFRVCLREMISFSGTHENLYVDWIALENSFSANMTDLDSIIFPNSVQPSFQDNYAYCQVRNFSRRFHEPPVVLVSANRRQGLSDQYIATWVKDVGITTAEVCIKDLPGIHGQHEPITVDYATIGDLDPCLDVTCDNFAVCRAFGPYDARCVCVTDCPSAEQNVCASNGRSFDNICLFQLEICQTKANYSYYHHGSCRGFPVTIGRRSVSEIPRWSESHCQTVQFDPLTFYPDKPVYVQISVSHVNDTSRVHDAAVSWVENVSDNYFTFCVMESGRNEGPPHGFATVEYMAYQGAPSGGLVGVMSMPEWWTGTKCQNVDITSGSFSSPPTVLVTAEHHRRSLKHDAASLWLEDVTSSSFQVCLRELQNFDGPHQDISVNWLAFETLERPLFSEHGSTNFAQTSQNPSASSNYAQCQDVALSGDYRSPPTVLVTPKHSTSGGNIDPKHNGISSWIETVTASSFKICFKELYTSNGYDAVTISHVVLKDTCGPGWVYYRGFCYKQVSACETWTNASGVCIEYSSNLVGINSPEEDVFVQHLHQGRPSWIGLNDQAIEGVYLWIDGGPVSYTHWAPGIGAPYSEAKDCVESSGRDTNYHWDSSACDNCLSFTCKKDFDECTQNTHLCDPIAVCINTVGTYTCQCPNGYTSSGRSCTDNDECNENTHTCDSNADCINTIGSYTCQCRSGYAGDGQTCTDNDECTQGTYTCDWNADCINTVGSYNCQCRSGYAGGGQTCTDVDECAQGTDTCDWNADCFNAVGSYTCQCHSGYVGDGRTCQWVYCGYPGYPYRGYKSGSAYTYGSVVYFYCDYSNEVLSGASSTTCQSDGTWSNPTPPRCDSYGIRLVGTSDANRGRVEIYHPSYGWGTVCDDGLDQADGDVICRQLGYTGASNTYHGAVYGQGTGTILLDNTRCSGSEAFLWDCPTNGWTIHDCSHPEDSSVDCY